MSELSSYLHLPEMPDTENLPLAPVQLAPPESRLGHSDSVHASSPFPFVWHVTIYDQGQAAMLLA